MKNYAFIDSQNLNLGILDQGWKLDFKKFRIYLRDKYKNYDGAVIVSGDGDFRCLVEYLESDGKLLKIIVPNGKYSSLLRKFAGYIVNIQLFKEKLKTK